MSGGMGPRFADLAFDLNQSFAEHWVLDADYDFLNHGSFGACPRVVLEAQRVIRDRMEAHPMRFMMDELEPLLDTARVALGKVVGAKGEDLVFVPNITHGVNTVLRSLELKPGDELLTTSHAYNACRMVLEFVAERSGAKVVVAEIPFPIEGPEVVIDAIESCVTERTVLALIDHITSPSALVFPIEEIVRRLQGRGVDVLVDGAHGPGMVELDIEKIGAAYYTANCHKWLCTPKGCGFLHVRKDKQEGVRPLCISHGANNPRVNRKRMLLEFDWPGTIDPSPYIVLPDAIRFLMGLYPEGLEGLMSRNHQLCVRAVKHLAGLLEVDLPAPESMLGSIASVRIPDEKQMPDAREMVSLSVVSPLQRRLYERHKIQTVLNYFPAAPVRYLRVAAQAYNTLEQFERLGEKLLEELKND